LTEYSIRIDRIFEPGCDGSRQPFGRILFPPKRAFIILKNLQIPRIGHVLMQLAKKTASMLYNGRVFQPIVAAGPWARPAFLA
jgi:hypothetical protein